MNHYTIYNKSIVSNLYYLENMNNFEIKSPQLFNPFRIFNEYGNYIKKQSYVPQNEDISITVNNTKYEKICFYIDNSWSFNYQCQFLELFPMIILAKQIINNNNYNSKQIDFFLNYKFKDMYEELFEIFNIDKLINKIYFKNIPDDLNKYEFCYETIYNFGIIHLHRRCTYPLCKIFTEYLKYYFKHKSINNLHNNNSIGLLRNIDNFSNTSSDMRYISNHNELVSFLQKNMFDIIYPDNMTLYERFCNLSYKKCIIVETGSTIVNLYFLENLNNIKIIVLCNENMYNFHGIFEDQIRHYFSNVSIIIGNMEDLNNEKSLGYVNYPYIINIKDIENILQ